MTRFLWIISVVLCAAFVSRAQTGASNPIPPEGSVSVVQTNYNQQSAPAAPALPTPSTVPAVSIPQASAPEKPAVIITAQGTVLTDEQKRLISQRLQEIPGVIVITNHIHVVGQPGQINEAAGAATTNRGRIQRSRNYRAR